MNVELLECSEFINKDEIKQSIPTGSLSEPLDNWRTLGMIEHRWRFIKLDDITYVEISRMYPFMCTREYYHSNTITNYIALLLE